MKGGQAVCQCPGPCDTRPDTVCANDGNSYINECSMKLSACKNKNPLRVLRKGQCGEWQKLLTYYIYIYYSCDVRGTELYCN